MPRQFNIAYFHNQRETAGLCMSQNFHFNLAPNSPNCTLRKGVERAIVFWLGQGSAQGPEGKHLPEKQQRSRYRKRQFQASIAENNVVFES